MYGKSIKMPRNIKKYYYLYFRLRSDDIAGVGQVEV
jgi:hypothetical protein